MHRRRNTLRNTVLLQRRSTEPRPVNLCLMKTEMSHRVSNTPINPPLIRLILYRNTLHKRAYKHTGENIDRYYKRCCSGRGDMVAATRVTRSQSQV